MVVEIFFGGRTQASVAGLLGVSQMQVSRILSKVLTWMRQGLLTDRVPRWATGPDGAETPFEVRAVLVPGGELEVTVTGEVDRDNAGRLQTELLDLVCRQHAGHRVTLRLSGVPLLDAAGVRVLLKVYEAAHARAVTVTVTGLSPMVRQIAAVSGLSPMLAPQDRP